MSDETDDELFEITDFTNASQWESFVSTIEDILQQWGLTASTYSADSGYWPQHRKSEKLSYVGHNFIVSLHVSGEKKRAIPKQSDQDWPDAMVHMMDSSSDFPPRAHHHISRWYGVDQFILISPDEKSHAISSEAQSKLLLSSISLAVANTGCTLPIFIQIQKNWRHMFSGQCEGCGLRTSFEMIHLRHIPPHFSHLSGLLNLFRSKLNGVNVNPPDINIAARLTYCLRHWNVEDWPVGPLCSGDGSDSFLTLPVGASSDPIQEIHLCAVWPLLTELTVTDNETNSGFDPFNAPKWSIRTQLLDNPGLLLNERLCSFLKNCYRSDTFTNLLGNKLLQEDIYNPAVGSSDFSHALTKLTSPSSLSTLSSVMYSTSKKLEFGSEFEPITASERDEILECLFPDSVPGSSLSGHEQLTEDSLTRELKSAPPNSLTMSLAKAFCNIHNDYGLKAMAHIWYEVIQELRYRWENGIALPSLGKSHPDMSCCLLHQKLQMLNNCILHKISHAKRLHYSQLSAETSESKLSPTPEEQSPTSSLSFSQRIQRQTSSEQQPLPQTPPSSTGYHKSTSTDSDEEFFEAQETFEEHDKEDLRTSLVSSLDSKTKKLDLEPLVNIDPLSLFASESEETDLFTGRGGGGGGGGKGRGEGVPIRIGALKPFKGLTLLKSNEQLYIPETQEQTPLTEDMLWEQQSVLSKLGTSEEAAQVRAKMQSMSLLSDMQAFKAANPGCVLEDFIRWYSPRDWIDSNDDDEEEESSDGLKPKENDPKGRLSMRMRQAGNMWVETWVNASPIPAYKQKRLFDDTKEAEKVLHWLSALKPAELVLMVLPCLVHSAVLHLKKELEEMELPSAWGYINDAINITKTMQGISLDSLPIYQECFGLLEKTEHDIATAASLHVKLKQGLDINTDSVKRTAAEDKELMASIQILVEEPELVLQDPVTSITGLAFQGLLKTQIAFQSLDEVSPSRHSRQHQTKVTGAALPKATAREFILRTVSPQPSLLSSPAPQRMFCFITKDETRVAGAFTQDVLIV